MLWERGNFSPGSFNKLLSSYGLQWFMQLSLKQPWWPWVGIYWSALAWDTPPTVRGELSSFKCTSCCGNLHKIVSREMNGCWGGNKIYKWHLLLTSQAYIVLRLAFLFQCFVFRSNYLVHRGLVYPFNWGILSYHINKPLYLAISLLMDF